MNLRLVNIDPKAGGAATVIYQYGQEKYEEGLMSGAIYASLVFIFLLCSREFFRLRAQ
jgi:hypothetical protein